MKTMTKGPRIHEAYQKVGFETAGREELLLMMYANILRLLRKARKSILKGQTTQSQLELLTAQGGVVDLLQTIRTSSAPDLAQSLKGLYHYVLRLLSRAWRGDLAALDEATVLMTELDQAWRVALRQAA